MIPAFIVSLWILDCTMVSCFHLLTIVPMTHLSCTTARPGNHFRHPHRLGCPCGQGLPLLTALTSTAK